jgi:hypothetical protein
MATPRFSFSGWNSFKLSPQVNPAMVSITTPGLLAPGAAAPAPAATSPGQLVAQTNAANTNLPAWLQTSVNDLNAQEALRRTLAGAVTGGAPAPTQNIGDILQGVAAVTAARGGFNTSLNQINEQARLQLLQQQRNQLRPQGAFGFMNPLDVNRSIGLDREIEAYRNVNLPLATGAVGGFRSSGWVNPFRTFA